MVRPTSCLHFSLLYFFIIQCHVTFSFSCKYMISLDFVPPPHPTALPFLCPAPQQLLFLSRQFHFSLYVICSYVISWLYKDGEPQMREMPDLSLSETDGTLSVFSGLCTCFGSMSLVSMQCPGLLVFTFSSLYVHQIRTGMGSRPGLRRPDKVQVDSQFASLIRYQTKQRRREQQRAFILVIWGKGKLSELGGGMS